MIQPRNWSLSAILLAGVLGITAGAGIIGVPAANGDAGTGGVATFAESPGAPPNFIFPFIPNGEAYETSNVNQFQYLMYRPLYWFGNGDQPTLNTALSLANYPTFSNGDTTVTLTLKNYQWSDGESVNAQDVVFWMNLMKVESTQFAVQVLGDVASISTPNSSTVVFNLTGPVNESWFVYNELSTITPLPLAWDVDSAGQATGAQVCANTDWNSVVVSQVNGSPIPANAAASNCVAVWTYLEGQSGYDSSLGSNQSETNSEVSSFATNPLWQVVDGPWHLTSLDTLGNATFEPNATYSGPVKPTLSQFVEVPFSSNAAEFSALVANQVSVGYLPTEDVTAPALSPTQAGANNPQLASNYNNYTSNSWQANYFPYNFNSVSDGGFAGQIFQESYFRQAFQMLIDQPEYISEFYQGYAVAQYGPVPAGTNDPFSSGFEQSNPYPYNPSQAIALLEQNGWTITPGGTDTCANASLCGVPVGTPLSFNLQYNSTDPITSEVVAAEDASWLSAGINVATTASNFDTVLSTSPACAGSACTWDFADWDGGWIYTPDIYPSGEYLFQSGRGGFNIGSFSNASEDGLISATNFTDANLDAFANATATLLPVVWQPTASQIVEVQNNLQGVTPMNPLDNLTPENWYFTSSPTTLSSISGTVSDASTQAGLGGICVNIYESSAAGFIESPGTTTAANGTYTISGLAAGNYDVQFSTGCGSSDDYVTQWNNDQPNQSTATPVSVAASGNPTVNASLVVGGQISGTVTSAQTGVGDACVYAFPPDSTTPAGSTGITNDSGNYTISGLVPGSYTLSVDPICGGYATTSPYAYQTLASPVTVTSGVNSANENFDLAADQLLTPAPPSTEVPAANFGTPTSVLTTSSATTIAQSELGATASVSVPAGALPNGTTISVYPVANPAVLAQSLPAAQAYVASFAVTWRAPDGTAPTASAPITMTITDPSIVAGDTIYQVTASGLVAAGSATVNGSATVTFTTDPTFVVAESTLVAQSPLTINTLTGRVGTSLTLGTSGGSGTGQVTYVVTNGTAANCAIAAGSLTASSAGTCVVTATKAADTTYKTVSTSPTNVTLAAKALPAKPAALTVTFTKGSSVLSASAKKALLALSKKLVAGASLTIVGYEKNKAKLAKSQASAVSHYLVGLVNVHESLKTSVTSGVNKVIVTTTKQ